MAYRLMPTEPDHQPPQPLQWPAVDDELLRTLPPVLRGVVKALGFFRARQFLDRHGGINICLPKHSTKALSIAADELARLRVELAPHMDDDDRVWMPKPDKLFQLTRNMQIKKDRLENSISELALSYKLSSRQILNICRDEDDDRQFDLF